MGISQQPSSRRLSTDLAECQTEHVMPAVALEKTRFAHPKSSLERQLTVGNADRYFVATKNMLEMLRKTVHQDIAFDIFQEGWSGSVTLT